MRIRRLRWQCRRGRRELDLVLTRYLDHRFASASADEQRAFEKLLEMPDPTLWNFLFFTGSSDRGSPEGRVLAELKAVGHGSG
jgi:antitoxin CptB